MIRYTKHFGVDYIVVDSFIELDGIKSSIQIQVNVSNIKEENRSKIFRIISIAFDRNINFTKSKPQPKKSWWKIW